MLQLADVSNSTVFKMAKSVGLLVTALKAAWWSRILAERPIIYQYPSVVPAQSRHVTVDGALKVALSCAL